MLKLVLGVLMVIGLLSCTENHYKKFIIEHKNNIKRESVTYYRIDSIKDSYYKEITIRKRDDSSLVIIFWGDRDSWKWNFSGDVFITTDIPYKRSNGVNVGLDLCLLGILNDKVIK